MKSYREYRVWELSHEVALAVYRESNHFPKHELFGLTSQMRRAASSVPMNIAEGSVKSGGEFQQSLRIALGSAVELDYQLLLAHDLGYLDDSIYEALDAKVTSMKKMLTRFLATVRANKNHDSPRPAQPADTYDLRPGVSSMKKMLTRFLATVRANKNHDVVTPAQPADTYDLRPTTYDLRQANP